MLLLRVPLLICFVFLANISFGQQFSVYPAPSKNFKKESNVYSITIIANGQKKKSFVYKTSGGAGATREWGRQQNMALHFTTFSFTGPVTIEVLKLNSSASAATIRPTRLGLTSTFVTQDKNRKLTFKLDSAAKIAVEFNDDSLYKNALLIFADKSELSKDIPDPEQEKVYQVNSTSDLTKITTNKEIVYFKPGVYKIGYWDIPAHIKQVYIAGGAYVIGYLNRNSNQIMINGRGIISNEGYNYHYPSKFGINDDDNKNWYLPIKISGGQNHVIEGITIIESTGYNIQISAKGSLIDNVKICGFRFNNDGITIGGSDNTINNCFTRVNDDAMVLYGSNLKISNCVFWQLQGSVFQLGWMPHTMNNIYILNCDILHDYANYSEGSIGFINAMNYQAASDKTAVDNVNVSNIYFDTPILRFLDIRGNRKNITSLPQALQQPEWVYRNFTFKNIYFSQELGTAPLIYLHGYSSEVPLINFKFENIYLNKKKVSKELFLNKMANFKNAQRINYQ